MVGQAVPASGPSATPPPRWPARWWWLAAVGPLAIMLYAAGGTAERAAVALAAVASVVAAARPRWRDRITAGAACLLVAAVLALVGHLLGDDFAYRYVWLYSAPELPWYIKLADLWGGDEGTLLLLAAMFAVAALRLIRHGGWTAVGVLLLAAVFAAAASAWTPFGETPAEDLARLASRGANAHLLSPWMAFHPPLVFIAYVAFLAPAGAALEALARGSGAWPTIAPGAMRAGWLILSAGLVSGMWWAYEDFSFGQIWHWDPVQTSVFVVWALATAQLHCLRRYQPRGVFALGHPLLAVLTGVAALASMAVTRSAVLASSHRYVGASSFYLVAALALALVGMAAVVLVVSRRPRDAPPVPAGESTLFVRIAVIVFSLAAALAAGHLANAYLSAHLGLPRPEALKPFFETLARWSGPGEIEALRGAFAQWDVNGFQVNAWLTPIALAIGLAGGHSFAPIRTRRRRWAATGAVAAAAALSAFVFQPAERLFTGTGMTSSSTVAIFPWLDALAVTTAWLAAAAAASMIAARPFALSPRLYRYAIPVGLVHLGVMIALFGGTVATVFDSHAQKMISWPDDFGAVHRFPDGFTVTLSLEDEGYLRDGGRTEGEANGFRSVARVGWTLERDGALVDAREGHTVYRDSRPPAVGGQGPVRLMCEMLDYRYARYVSGDALMIHPFIHRGLWRDVQVWFPAIDYRAGGAASSAPERAPSTAPVVLKVYPLMSWLWIGLALALAGAAMAWAGASRPDAPGGRTDTSNV